MTEVPQWEPEPLHLPVDEIPVEHRQRRGHRKRPRRERDEKVTGSHVIVIDLA